jgi:hypothetical protein
MLGKKWFAYRFLRAIGRPSTPQSALGLQLIARMHETRVAVSCR